MQSLPVVTQSYRKKNKSDSLYMHIFGSHPLTCNHYLLPYCSDQYDSADSQGSDFDPGGGAQRRKPRPSDYVRMTSRKKGTISYKESSGSELTDSDMVVERGEGAPAEEDNREGIEKVLMKRMGRVGGRCIIHL